MTFQGMSEHYRPGELDVVLDAPPELSRDRGFFRFGGATCYGRTSTNLHVPRADMTLYDIIDHASHTEFMVKLPFDPLEIINNLRNERYISPENQGSGFRKAARRLYYFARPLLGVGLRKHLQRASLNGWRQRAFPRWPVDVSVESLMKQLVALVLKARNGVPIPFIWFWPEGATACAVMTHDVETIRGVAFSSHLMDLNESASIPASFQIVPEKRYHVSDKYLDEIRRRGFEINVQDLNHDGRLFCDPDTFKQRAQRINEYATAWNAMGFRAGVLYRNQDWFHLLKLEYDMSVPNVAHLDPQRGGCCTVMPYFIGNILELPVTVTQDYSLFNILNDYSLRLWKQQTADILAENGLMNFIVHPDYIVGSQALGTYKALLGHLQELREQQNVWVALPRDVNTWWRQRKDMRIARKGGEYRIEGKGSERARIAFLSLRDEQVAYQIAPGLAVPN